ncbi:proton-conducting transporter transmembrane domain-containing protein [Microcella humidisoli]|uniref:NADH:quinone oxidoreductase/Mrp antiporter transmembrane domain-containing protein n=1 Tax=Microcella humidisoli TaxID=2963406 RepID=A0ABY5FXW9_9MICO|nr:proton-conducting transporter membrane subunit [Microcella humidisoli]UTT62913.1 hypothetical protein NNL39_02035 [Microcella humidisoli]
MSPLDLTWRLDPTAILLLVLVVGVAVAVLPFAHRSLRGDRHGAGVTLSIVAMLSATALLVVAGELWMLALAWSLATAATLAALGLGGGRPALRRAGPWLIVGDVVLWLAVVLAAAGTAGEAPAVLLVIAAAVRCALPPAHPWLVDSLYAPTPVSAALHGGIVNGGGILVITQFSLIASSPAAITLLAALGTVAIVAGVLAALVRTDIKGRLVASTVAQMGFMMLVASLGLLAAALLHLVAHGFYKSALFLSSSDGIDRRAAERRAPRPFLTSATERRVRTVAGALVPVAALVAVALVAYPGGRGPAELLLLVTIAVAFATAGARAAGLAPSRGRAAALVALIAVGAVAFAAATSALTGALGLARPAEIAAQPLALVFALLAVTALAALAAVRRWAPAGRWALMLIAVGHGLGGRAVRIDRSREVGSASAPARRTGHPRTSPRTSSTPMGATA